MSANSTGRPDPDEPWLSQSQQRVWLAWIRISLRMEYEMHRQLQEDNGLSLADYHVLTTLGSAPGERMQLSDLANTIGWERTRLSHHLRRMSARELTRLTKSETDGRATDATLAPAGRRALDEASAGHARHVRRLFFGGLAPDDLAPFADTLESVYAGLLECGTLPPPPVIPSAGT